MGELVEVGVDRMHSLLPFLLSLLSLAFHSIPIDLDGSREEKEDRREWRRRSMEGDQSIDCSLVCFPLLVQSPPCNEEDLVERKERKRARGMRIDCCASGE